MGVVQLNQIKNRIIEGVGPHIDASDSKVGQADDLRLTRGLAAFALVELVGTDEKSGASAITDGYNDNGIDAIYIDSDSSRVYLVQSKW